MRKSSLSCLPPTLSTVPYCKEDQTTYMHDAFSHHGSPSPRYQTHNTSAMQCNADILHPQRAWLDWTHLLSSTAKLTTSSLVTQAQPSIDHQACPRRRSPSPLRLVGNSTTPQCGFHQIASLNTPHLLTPGGLGRSVVVARGTYSGCLSPKTKRLPRSDAPFNQSQAIAYSQPSAASRSLSWSWVQLLFQLPFPFPTPSPVLVYLHHLPHVHSLLF
jgi:hypothetical protein